MATLSGFGAGEYGAYRQNLNQKFQASTEYSPKCIHVVRNFGEKNNVFSVICVLLNHAGRKGIHSWVSGVCGQWFSNFTKARICFIHATV